MKGYKLFILISFLICQNAFSTQIKSEIKLSGELVVLKEGDLVEATLLFWPIENPDMGEFKKLEKNLLFKSLYLIKILNADVSPNNADVVELRALFVVKGTSLEKSFSFKYLDNLIEIPIGEIKIEGLKEKTKDFIVLSQASEKSRVLFILGALFLLLSLACFFKRRVLIDFFKKWSKRAEAIEKKRWDDLFKKANSRSDFEFLYKEKKKWMEKIVEKSSAYEEFFTTINEHQFKKEWSSEEFRDVKSSFDVIRGSFEK